MKYTEIVCLNFVNSTKPLTMKLISIFSSITAYTPLSAIRMVIVHMNMSPIKMPPWWSSINVKIIQKTMKLKCCYISKCGKNVCGRCDLNWIRCLVNYQECSDEWEKVHKPPEILFQISTKWKKINFDKNMWWACKSQIGSYSHRQIDEQTSIFECLSVVHFLFNMKETNC